MRKFSDKKICSMPASELAKLALGKILFSDRSELFKLALCSSEETNLKSVNDENLLAISEIKKNKDGSTDIKFFDKLKAAEIMFEIGREENENQDSGTAFLEGFLKSAKEISLSKDESEKNNNSSGDFFDEEGKV